MTRPHCHASLPQLYWLGCKAVMNNEESLSAETVIIGETALVAVGLLATYRADFPPTVPLNYLFPAHILYCLLLFLRRRPDATVGRRLLVGWLLVFGDWLVLNRLGETWPVPHLVFAGFFLGLDLLPEGVPAAQLSGHLLRGTLYLGEALYKAFVLVDSVQTVFQTWYDDGHGLSLALVIAVVRLITPALVYATDQLVWAPADKTEYLGPYLRTVPFAAAALLWLLSKQQTEVRDKQFSLVHLVVCTMLLAWYGYEAVLFAREEEKQE